MSRQYLDSKELEIDIPDVKIQVTGTLTYHEEILLNKLLNWPKDVQKLLLAAALQISIVGYGNKNFGKVVIDGVEHDVRDSCKDYINFMKSGQSGDTKPDEFTPRRVIRIFRQNIYNYLVDHPDVRPYLYNRNPHSNRALMFSGAEHFIVGQVDADNYITAVKVIDERRGTRIADRVKSVFSARGVAYTH